MPEIDARSSNYFAIDKPVCDEPKLEARCGSVPKAIPAGSRFDKNRLYQRRYWSTHLFELVAEIGVGMDGP